MSRKQAEAQARYRARQALKLAFFDRMDAERVRVMIHPDYWNMTPERAAVHRYAVNHPGCFHSIPHIYRTPEPGWAVEFQSGDKASRFNAAVALAALLETTSLPVQAVGRDETFGPDDPAVKQARAEIAEMKRLGIWERHA